MEDYQLYQYLNDIVVEHGVQAGPKMIQDAFFALDIWHWSGASGTPAFPARLECHREWLRTLTPGRAEKIRQYMVFATALAYRYLRKKRRAR
jgi:hypothetical protein